MRKVDAAVRRKTHRNDGCKTFAPRHFVGVMFEWSDEDDGLMCAQMFCIRIPLLATEERGALGVVTCARCRWTIDAENLLQLDDRTGCTGADGDDGALAAGIQRSFDG